MSRRQDSSDQMAAKGFPETCWTLVRDAGQRDTHRSEQALAKLCEVYWQPICNWLQASGMDSDEAKEDTQELIRHLLAQRNLTGYQRERGRFRHYLIAILRNLLRDQHRAKARLKRGGQSLHVPLEETKLAANTLTPDQQLDRGFARVVHGRALATTRRIWERSGRLPRFSALCTFIFRRPIDGEYKSIAIILGLTAVQVTRSVFDLREDYYNTFREEVAQTVVPEELADEIRHLVSLLAAEG